MKKKLCVLTVVFAIVMIVATGQRGFADYSKLDQSANGLSSIVNTTFGLTGASALGSNADLVSRYGTTAVNGTFKLNETQVFLLSWNTTASMLGFDGNGSNFNSLGTGFHWLSAGYSPTSPMAISNASFGTSRLLYTGTVDGQFGFSIRSFDQLHSSLTNFGSGSGSAVVSGNFPSADYYVYFDVTNLVASYYPGFRAYLVGFQDTQMAASGFYGFDGATFLVLERWDGGGPGPGGVPEPATLFLWTLGGLSMAGASWRRKRTMKKLLA